MVECAPAFRGIGLPDIAPAGPAFAGAATSLEILRFMAEAERRGLRAALVTITGLTGSSSRPVGTLMGVAEDGCFAGSFSGGCIEAAVVAEAVEAIRDGRPPRLRGYHPRAKRQTYGIRGWGEKPDPAGSSAF